MERKSGRKSRDVKRKAPSPCSESCAKRPELGCFTLTTSKYRDISKYIPQEEKHEEEDPTNQGQVEDVYFAWLGKKKTEGFWYVKFLSDKEKFQPVFQRILDDQRSCLQYPPTLTKIIPFGSLDSGYIVRYKNPWDFHVILEHQPLYWCDEDGVHEQMETWEKYFPMDKMRFQSGVELFRKLTALLSRYMGFWHKENRDQEMNPEGEEKKKPCFKQGDLVICAVPRKDDCEINQRIMLGYRAVVVQNDMKVMTLRGDQVKEGNCMRLYFLDTGENRLVEQDSDFVAPLPEVFSVFRPLAIPCALHGISPVGIDWSKAACLEMKKMALNGQLPSPLLLEFYTNTKAKKPTAQNVALEGTLSVSPEVKPAKTSLLWETPTYFVELTANVDDNRSPSTKRVTDVTEIESVSLDVLLEEGKRVNVTTEMIIQNLGLQWNLFPDRPELYPFYFDLEKKSVNDAKEDFEYLQGKQLDPVHSRRAHEKLERGDLLKIYTEHYKKIPMKIKGDEKIRSQINVAFILNEDLDSQVMTIGKEIGDNKGVVEEEDDDDDMDAGNNVLSTLFNLAIN